MKRELRSAGRFDRKLASLFETFESRDEELQTRLDELVRGLLDGTITIAPEHHPDDDTCCLPLIDNFVIVFKPSQSIPKGRDEKRQQNLRDFSKATRFDLLNIEEEP